MVLSDDPFVQSSASFLLKYYTLFANASDVQTTKMASLGNHVIKTQGGSLASWLLNVVALGYGQLFSKVDRMLDTLFIVMLVGITGLFMLLCAQDRRYTQWIAKQKDRQEEAPAIVQRGDDYESVADKVRPCILQLETLLRTSMVSDEPEMSSAQIEAAVSARMQGLAPHFLQQAQNYHDATAEIAIMLKTGGSNRLLLFLKTFGSFGNPAAALGIVIEIIFETQSSNENVLFVLQGVVVGCLGLDMLNTAIRALAVLSMEPQPQLTGHSARHFFIVPTVWLLLFGTCFSSHSYYCDGLCQTKHYLYPVYIIVKNQSLWLTLCVWGKSALSAAVVLFMFFCILMCSTAIAMLMLSGVYEIGDFYSDNQVAAFTTSCYMCACNYVLFAVLRFFHRHRDPIYSDACTRQLY